MNKRTQLFTSKEELVNIFKDIGLEKGSDVMVHSSMKSLGYVVNGALDVIDALIECVGINEGTVLMPTHSGQLADPSSWINPIIPRKYISTIKKNMLPFDKKRTPVRGRGEIPTTFLSYPRVQRSSHPLNSVGALGRKAKFYTELHDFHSPEGINSPIGKLYKNNGKVLGIGVGVNRFTAIHLAEYLMDVHYLNDNNPNVLFEKKHGKNIYKRINKYPGKSDNFTKILPSLRSQNLIQEKDFKLGIMTCFPIQPVIDCVVDLLKQDPEFLIKE